MPAGAPISHASAKQTCKSLGGYLAVTISDWARETLGGMMNEGAKAFVALEQLHDSAYLAEKSMNWHWIVDGLLNLTQYAGMSWALNEPDDNNPFGLLDEGRAQFGALFFDYNRTALADVNDTEVTNIVCQFRNHTGLMRLLATNSTLYFIGKEPGPTEFNVETAEHCAMFCYVSPACMAVSYSLTMKTCTHHLDRPQDYHSIEWMQQPDTEVWVKP